MKKEDIEIFYLEGKCSGGIIYAWATDTATTIDENGDWKHKQICIGNQGEDEEILKQRAIRAWASRDKAEKLTDELQLKYPGRQLYQGHLPECNIEYERKFGGEYIYVLKDRRKKGKYQVLEAVPIC